MPRRVSAASLALNNQPHALYRFFDHTDVLLYVGITADLSARMKNHAKGKPWWTQIANITVEHFATRQEALDAEKKAIREEKPLHNDQHNPHVWVSDLPDPAKIDGAWITEHWRKVNPGIRDYVEMPAWNQGRTELAEELLENVHPGDLQRLAEAAREKAKADDEDEPVGDELVVRSAVAAFQELGEDHHQLTAALKNLLAALLADDYVTLLFEAKQEWIDNVGNPPSETDALSWLAYRTTRGLYASYFDRLSPEEQSVWLAVAKNLGDWGATQRDMRTEAGNYALILRQRGQLPTDLCQGGIDGGICTAKANLYIRLSDCPYCMHSFQVECWSHRIWCDEHLDERDALNHWVDRGGVRLVIEAITPGRNLREVEF